MLPHVARAGRPRDRAGPAGRPCRRAGRGRSRRTRGQAAGRTDLHTTIDTEGRTADRRERLRQRLRRLGRRCASRRRGPARRPRLDADVRRRAARRRAGPGRHHRRRGAGAAARRRRRAGRGGRARRRAAGRHRRRRRHLRRQPEHQLHQRLLHRLPVLRVRPAAHRRRRLHAVPGAGRRPRRGGVGAGRHRGVHAGRHPPGPAGHRLLRHRRGRSSRGCRGCTCTRSARWRSSTARREPACRSASGSPRRREAGLGSIPGTAAEILDDDVRWLLTKGKLPAATWIEVVTTAHELGIRSSPRR